MNDFLGWPDAGPPFFHVFLGQPSGSSLWIVMSAKAAIHDNVQHARSRESARSDWLSGIVQLRNCARWTLSWMTWPPSQPWRWKV